MKPTHVPLNLLIRMNPNRANASKVINVIADIMEGIQPSEQDLAILNEEILNSGHLDTLDSQEFQEWLEQQPLASMS